MTARDGAVLYPIGRSLYVNLTSRCTLRCTFCPKWSGDWTVKGHDLRLRRQPTIDEVWALLGGAAARRHDEVVFCGLGEPTRRLGAVLSLGARLRASGVRVRLDTDGLASLRAGRDVTPDLARAVDAVSVSLNAPDAATYARLCPSRFGAAAHAAVCAFLRAARARGIAATATVVDLPGLDLGACARLARSMGVPLAIRPQGRLGSQERRAPR